MEHRAHAKVELLCILFTSHSGSNHALEFKNRQAGSSFKKLQTGLITKEIRPRTLDGSCHLQLIVGQPLCICDASLIAEGGTAGTMDRQDPG